jgi:hypothetical protein
MVAFPVLSRLQVKDYAMYPGDPPGSGLDRGIPDGVTLIAGINGLGKTTLLNIILRLLTGPNDLTSMGAGQLGTTLPQNPVRLSAQTLRFFGQRVADNARDATAKLEANFGERHLAVELGTLRLVDAAIDGKSILGPGLPIDEIEQAYQTGLCELMGLSSFIDVLLVLHYAVFFSEERPGALWDINAQRQLLRALFLPGPAAAQIAEAERQVAGADNYARQVQFVLSRHRRSLDSMLQAQAAAPALLAKLKPQQAILEASLNRRSALDERRETISGEMEATRLDYERAKIGREDAERAVERLKFEALSRMFPKLPDVARLTLLTLLSKSECLVCGAHAETARAAIEAELSEGSCPVCHSPPEQQENIVSVQQVEGSRLARARERAELAATEESAQKDNLDKITGEYEAILVDLKAISTEIAEIERFVRVLLAQLPAPSEEVQRLQLTVDDLTKSLKAANGRRAELAEELRAAFVPAQEAAEEQSEVLVRAFEHHARALLDEEATLVRDTARPAIAQ